MKTAKNPISNSKELQNDNSGDSYGVSVAGVPSNKKQALKKLVSDFNYYWKWRVNARKLVKGSKEYEEHRKNYLEERIDHFKKYLGKSPREIWIDEDSIDARIDMLVEYLQALKKSAKKVELFREFCKHQALVLPGTLHYNFQYQSHQVDAAKEFLKELEKEVRQLKHDGRKGKEPALPDSHKEYLKKQYLKNPERSQNSIITLYREHFKLKKKDPLQKGPASRGTVQTFLKKLANN